MATVPVTGQFIKRSDKTGAQGVEVNVPHQFQQVLLSGRESTCTGSEKDVRDAGVGG